MLDLKDRTRTFAFSTRNYCKLISYTIISDVYIKQLVRSSSSVGANYLESIDNLGKQDQLMRLKIVRKELRESSYWLELLQGYGNNEQRKLLLNESQELLKIFSSIIKTKYLK